MWAPDQQQLKGVPFPELEADDAGVELNRGGLSIHALCVEELDTGLSIHALCIEELEELKTYPAY